MSIPLHYSAPPLGPPSQRGCRREGKTAISAPILFLSKLKGVHTGMTSSAAPCKQKKQIGVKKKKQISGSLRELFVSWNTDSDHTQSGLTFLRGSCCGGHGSFSASDVFHHHRSDQRYVFSDSFKLLLSLKAWPRKSLSLSLFHSWTLHVESWSKTERALISLRLSTLVFNISQEVLMCYFCDDEAPSSLVW